MTASADEPLWEAGQVTNSTTHIIDVSNSSNYLSLDESEIKQQQYESVSLDVAGAVQGDALRLQGEHRKRGLQQQLSNTEDERAFHDRLLTELEQSALALETQERQLYRQYGNGDIRETQLFRELVRLGVAGEQYRNIADVMQQAIDTDSLSSRYSNFNGEPSLLQSAFLSQIETGLSTADATQMYVQAGNESLILASVEDGTFLREATLLGEYDRDASEQFGIGDASEARDALERAQNLYPWSMKDTFNPQLRGFGNSATYRVTSSHTHGTLQTYIDGRTTNPYHEIHEKNAFSVPVTDFTQATNDGIRIDIQLTNPTGPMLIEVIETDDLIYNNITVSVEDTPIRTMSSGGDFYTVQPVGSFEITAETDTGQEVSIAVFPD
ncbi:DUF7094 domain-containing protein [Halovenus salina]|uniref:Uncharacterized protein n=1 Tax=Halovenus salina TaxID=1510225 RepID=A0ABD5W442_9EURY